MNIVSTWWASAIEEIGQRLAGRKSGQVHLRGQRVCSWPLIRIATVKSCTRPESISREPFRPSANSIRNKTGSGASDGSCASSGKTCPNPALGDASRKLRQRQASKSCEVASPRGPRTAFQCFPDVRALRAVTARTPVSPPLRRSTMHWSDSRAMKIVAVDSAVADADRLGDLGAQRQIDCRQAPGDR